MQSPLDIHEALSGSRDWNSQFSLQDYNLRFQILGAWTLSSYQPIKPLAQYWLYTHKLVIINTEHFLLLAVTLSECEVVSHHVSCDHSENPSHPLSAQHKHQRAVEICLHHQGCSPALCPHGAEESRQWPDQEIWGADRGCGACHHHHAGRRTSRTSNTPRFWPTGWTTMCSRT